MKQDGLFALQTIRLAKQILHRETFKHHGSGFFVADAFRQMHDLRGRYVAGLCIGTDWALAVSDTIALFKTLGGFFTNGDHLACTLKAQASWHGTFIQPGPKININKVQTCSVLTDGDLVFTRRRDFDLDQF